MRNKHPWSSPSTPSDSCRYDHEAEAAVIGGLLIDGEALHRVLPLIKAEDFHRARNQFCFDACVCGVPKRGDAVDQITVARELQQREPAWKR